MIARLRTFAGDRRGVTALEFALISPILALVVVMGVDGWTATRQALDMRTALQTGARYYQVGGTDDAQARATTLAAWSRRSDDGVVTVSRACKCATTVTVCSATCSGGQPPAVFVTLTASSSFDGAVRQAGMTEHEVIRVR
ncbi:TadE/TadG family type IV pilus assembly protein [Phenylobacterium sp.]|jgi:Flp pilus assembly protein TadG|uniref:TadE/TadG family type IV pilus assembly protein n=1 Tax=Phenylobacterium sp. TaxID=1871053 RepID=UPI002F93F5C8